MVVGNGVFATPPGERNGRLKPQMRYKAHGDSLILHLQKHPVLYRDYLAPSTLAKLNSALQRPDISDDFRNQITEILSK